MSEIDVTKFHKLNVWRQPDGCPCTRPGLRDFVLIFGGFTFVGGFSVRNDFVGDTWHYIACQDDATGLIEMVVFDENFDVFSRFAWGYVTPRVVTHAIVEGQILITSPDLPSLVGMVGGGSVWLADPIASDNTTTTAIAVPRGICTNFCNRVAVFDGRSGFFSDPIASDGGDVRTFVAENQNQRPGVCYGLHEGAGGSLVAVTSAGTYALDADASAVDIVGSNGTAWRLLSHHGAASYQSSCVHRGRVYALTTDGYAPVDVEGNDEVFLTDQTMPRARGPSAAMPDFRRCSLFTTDEGPLVAAPQIKAFHRSDLQRDVFSWWRDQTDDPGDVVGILKTPGDDGADMLLFPSGAFIIMGDCDTADTNLIPLTSPVGTLSDVVPGGISRNQLPRKVHFGAAVDGAEEIYAAVRGSEHGGVVDADPFGLIIDVDAWGASGKRYVTTPIADIEVDFGDISDTAHTRDVGLELSASGCNVRLSDTADLVGVDDRRPQAKA